MSIPPQQGNHKKPRPTRVGYVLRAYPRFSQTFVVNEILGLESQGFDVRIASLKKPTDGRFHESISRVKAKADYLPERFLDAPRKTLRQQLGLLRSRPGRYGAAVGAVVRHAGASFNDLVQAGSLLRWVKKNRLKHVHVHFGTSEASVAYLANCVGGLSYSLTLHAFDIFRDNVDRRLLARKINASRFTVTVSEFNRRFMVENLPGVDPDKIRVNYNGVDLSLFDVSRCPGDEPSVLGVGRLIEKKGFGYLITALGILRDRGVFVRGQIVGDGPERAPLQAEIDRLKLSDRVRLLGPLPQHHVRRLLSEATCFALPCVHAADGNVDALPTVLLEALASGCPCVSTRVSGVPEIIEDGESGLLVGGHEVEPLADAIGEIVTDRALAERFSRNGRRRAEALFSLQKNVARHGAWLAEACMSDAPPLPRDVSSPTGEPAPVEANLPCVP